MFAASPDLPPIVCTLDEGPSRGRVRVRVRVRIRIRVWNRIKVTVRVV